MSIEAGGIIGMPLAFVILFGDFFGKHKKFELVRRLDGDDDIPFDANNFVIIIYD